MEFIASRELRTHPGVVWKRLASSGRVVITSNGKPIAIMKDIHDKDLEEEWEAEIIADGVAAVSRMRQASRKRGLDKLSQADIRKEISASRKGD